MSITSKTGLLASIPKPVERKLNNFTPQLITEAIPAPFLLRPFAGLYNPFPHACSLLCNHPAPVLPIPINRDQVNDPLNAVTSIQNEHPVVTRHGSVPEELFRRYTDTDSRPLTPAPTVTSAATTAAIRRCVTPEPVTLRPKLVVDLRRTHSQETLSWTIYSETTKTVTQESPGSTASSSHSSVKNDPIKKPSPTPRKSREVKKSPRQPPPTPVSPNTTLEVPQFNISLSENSAEETDHNNAAKKEDDDDAPRRRGKKKKIRDSSRLSSRNPRLDPVTQIASMGDDDTEDKPMTSANEQTLSLEVPNIPRKSLRNIDSFLEPLVIRQLQRELDRETIETEFDEKRKVALEEAFRCLPSKRTPGSVLAGWTPKPIDIELWLTLPRTFSRSSARFELPLNSRELNKITPIEYVRNYVSVSNTRRLLYNCIFNRNREMSEDEDEERKLLGSNIILALGEMMGKPFTKEQAKYFHELVGWSDTEWIDFRTWCGICALCERILAIQFCPQLPDKNQDPGNEIERVDFETLLRKLIYLKPDERIVKMLIAIKES